MLVWELRAGRLLVCRRLRSLRWEYLQRDVQLEGELEPELDGSRSAHLLNRYQAAANQGA